MDNDDFDSTVTKLFDRTQKPLEDDYFVHRVSVRVARARSRRNLIYAAFWLTPIIAASIATPIVFRSAVILAKLLDGVESGADSFIKSPAGLAVFMVLCLLIYRHSRRLT
jgi:hypothetical protein